MNRGRLFSTGLKSTGIIFHLFFLILFVNICCTCFAAEGSAPPPDNEDEKKEERFTTTDQPSYHNIVSTVQKFFESADTSVEMKIARNLLRVKEGPMKAPEFYRRLSEMQMPEGKESRHMLQKIKKDIYNQLGQKGLDYILGTKNSMGGTPVETELLGFRHGKVMGAVKKASLRAKDRTVKNGHRFKVYFAEIGSWSSKIPESLTFDIDIDACILCGDLALALEIKRDIEADIKTEVGLSAEAFDTPITAHGLAEHEVYLAKHGQAYAEKYMDTRTVYEIKDGVLRNGSGEGILGKQALINVVIDRKFADVKIADLVHTKHPSEPGISLEMIRHFEHDIINQNIAGDIDSFVKAAKYLERSFSALKDEFGIAPGSMKNSSIDTVKLAGFVDRLIAVKEGRLTDVDPVDIIRGYFESIHQEIPIDIKLGPRNTDGLTPLQIQTKEKFIQGFWDDCRKVMWDNAVKGFELNYQKVKKFMNPKDLFMAKKNNMTIKKLYEMMAIENMVLHDSHIGLKKIPSQFENLMKQFHADYKEYTSKWGLEMLDEQAKAQVEFIKKNIEVSLKDPQKSNMQLAIASLTTLANAPLKLNAYLDILDDTLMDDLHKGEWKAYLEEARSATLGQKVDQYLENSRFQNKWRDVHQGQFKNFLDKSGDLYVKAENKMNQILLDNFAARGIQNINRQFSQAVESSRAAQGAMTAMALISLKDELPVYYYALSEGNWEKLAVEFFRRRVPGSGAVENVVMGKYYSAAWDTVTTLIPAVAMVNTIHEISKDLGTQAWKTMWSEELNLFIDELYENSKFAPSGTVKHGNDLEITNWTLISTEYRSTEIKLDEEIENLSNEVREMDDWWEKHAKEDPGKRTAPFPSHKYQDNLANWMKVNDMLWINIRANDNVLMYLDEVAKNYKLGEVMDLYYVYMRQIRWAKVKLQFLNHLKAELEKRKATEKIILDGNDLKVIDELLSIASKLGIKDEVKQNLEAEVGGDIWEIYSAVRDWFHGLKREHMLEPKIWEEYKEKIKISADWLQIYRTIWEERLNLETLFSMSDEDKEQVRLLTGPDFLTGNAKKDEAILGEWKDTIKKALWDTKGELSGIKQKYVSEALVINPGHYDYDMLTTISSSEIVKKIHTWSFRHSKGDKKEVYRERANVLEAERKKRVKAFEDHYKAMAVDPKALDQIKKDLESSENLSKEAAKKCTDVQSKADEIKKALTEHDKNFQQLEANLKNISAQPDDKMQNIKEIEQEHAAMEKRAAEVMRITQELENLSLRICETTKSLNDYKLKDDQHQNNYVWIDQQKAVLKDSLTRAKQMMEAAVKAYEKARRIVAEQKPLDQKAQQGIEEQIKVSNTESEENQKELETANIDLLTGKKQADDSSSLKTTSEKKLEELEKQISVLMKTDTGKEMKKRIDELKSMAGKIYIKDCPESVSTSIEKLVADWDEREKRIKKIAGLYSEAKKKSAEDEKSLEGMNQNFQNLEYLADLSKAYVERAEKAAVDSAFCATMADGIMERSFPPNVVGKDFEQAISLLRKKGFNVSTDNLGRPASESDSGKVVSQNYSETQRLAKGTTILISYYEKVDDRAAQLAHTDCSQWPGSYPVWDENNNRPGCGCTGGTVWDAFRTRCISQEEAMMAATDCSLFPNTQPVWNDAQGRPMCDCIPGTVWNFDRTACVDQRQIALENTDCSQFPGTVPVWDNQRNQPGCKCPDGTQWIQQMNQCVSQQELALANADCSHKPGSKPVWNYATGQVECECQMPYTQDYLTGGCVDLLAEERKRQDEFNRQQQEANRRNQEQMNNMFNNMMNIWPQMNNPGNSPPNSPLPPVNGQPNLCEMEGLKVIGIWDESGRWFSCLTGANLQVGASRMVNGVRADCVVSSWPPQGKRVPCGTMTGHCTIRVIVLESKNYGPMGFLKKGEEVCAYLY